MSKLDWSSWGFLFYTLSSDDTLSLGLPKILNYVSVEGFKGFFVSRVLFQWVGWRMGTSVATNDTTEGFMMKQHRVMKLT
jgi:hypothetical protein